LHPGFTITGDNLCRFPRQQVDGWNLHYKGPLGDADWKISMVIQRQLFRTGIRFFRAISILVLMGIGACASHPATVSLPDASSLSRKTVPIFDHIFIITFENREYDKIIGNLLMPTFNTFAKNYSLLTQYYAVAHPSLPNYIAMIGGDTFGIQENCKDCFINAPSLADEIEASGRTWKTYQEDMDIPCGLGSQDESEYVQKHNPFIYFDPIRTNQERCERSVVPLETLQSDLEAGTLPNYAFITPNMCNNAHDCPLFLADRWLDRTLKRLIPALEEDGPNYLIVLNWDEGQQDGGCCNLPEPAGGRIAVVLISPLVKSHFTDSTPYSHYSLLKTIENSWDLPYLGHSAEDSQFLILAPWK
jgi:hypothetical protein